MTLRVELMALKMVGQWVDLLGEYLVDMKVFDQVGNWADGKELKMVDAWVALKVFLRESGWVLLMEET